MSRNLYLACVVGCVAASTVALADSRSTIVLPKGERPIVDGTLSPEEWSGARREPLVGGGELLLMGDSHYLYLGLRAGPRGIATVFVAGRREISLLHASGALGTATYTRSQGSWKRTREFSWRCHGASQDLEARKEREQHLDQEHWVASNGDMGVPTEFEYVIEMPTGSLTVAVAYLQPHGYDSVVWWPAGLEDDCRSVAVVRGDSPASLTLSPGTWAVVTAVPTRRINQPGP